MAWMFQTVCVCICVRSSPALASDTAREIALLEMALLRFMISSNSASLSGVLAESISLHTRKTHKGQKDEHDVMENSKTLQENIKLSHTHTQSA